MSSLAEKVLERYGEVVEHGFILKDAPSYRSYSVSNLRGGVGKSTVTFNLAFEISRKNSVLVADLCPQGNLTETLMRDYDYDVTIAKALLPKLLGPAFGDELYDVSYQISRYCDNFKGGKPSYLIPGDPEMFAFPSTLYQQLQVGLSRGDEAVVKRLLLSLHGILKDEAKDKKCDFLLMDTSPFYAGGTHLAWCASEAIVIPVRVDEHSIESLGLTLDMLSNSKKDFMIWNKRAGGLKSPKVAAIVMTMAGSRGRLASTPGSASQVYIERALKIAERYSSLFEHDRLSDAFVITDDFVSSGQISGAKSIPISKLKIGQFHNVDGKRLQVNQSITRYQREIAYLASVI